LPISSSAHLILLPWFLGIEGRDVNKLVFDIVLHFGTLLALLCVYGRSLLRLLKTSLRQRDLKENLLLKLCVATLPGGLAGLFGEQLVEERLRSPGLTIWPLVAVSLFMLIAERRRGGRSSLSYRAALIMGMTQAFSLIPGTSRSGITIATGLILGLERGLAVEFSFLMAIPIVFGASLLGVRTLYVERLDPSPYLFGLASSFIFGSLSLKFLIAYLARHRLDLFAYYRLCLAVVILLFSFMLGQRQF